MMKNIFFLITLLVTNLSFQLNAAESKKDFSERFEQVTQRLALSPEQVEAITPILISSAERTKEVLAKYGINIEQGKDNKNAKLGFSKLRKMAKEMASEREKTTAALSVHLNDQQMKEYTEIQAERKKMMRERLLSR
ncbi:MAG: hypothetical protein BM565_06375 [Gammaproteobacteria bacterium MedPE]|nr:MAG: hypothetical protein BM565_06375 [Gammaproteobacteria bacterium MedPE]